MSKAAQAKETLQEVQVEHTGRNALEAVQRANLPKKPSQNAKGRSDERP